MILEEKKMRIAVTYSKTIWDTILWDLVRDPYSEGNGIVSQLLENLPEIQKIEFMRELELRALALIEIGDKDSVAQAAALRQSIEEMR